MTESKPYLIRAMHEWISDNSLTPYLYVDTSQKGLSLPDNLYAENPLVLNISASASQHLVLGNDDVTFQARFAGRVFDIYLPMSCIMAIIARENGQGMTFEVGTPETEADEGLVGEEADTNESGVASDKKPSKRGLKVIK